MQLPIKTTPFLSGLKLIKKHWGILSIAFLASLIILGLDFLLTISIPKVIETMKLIIASENILNIQLSTLILVILIVLRPIVGWLINFIQIRILLNILRNLENDIALNSKLIYESDMKYSSENSANMLISHGRYYVDNYLIPLIRALTDIGSIIVISIGLFIQFPIPLLIFVLAISLLLTLYQLTIGGLLRRHGKILLNAIEKIIKLSEEGFTKKSLDHDINLALDEKRKATLIMGSISQGLKYVIEFCFMFSFSVATIYMLIFSSNDFIAFVSTFAYAAVRMLPSFTTILAFFQGKSSAEHAMIELSNHLKVKI